MTNPTIMKRILLTITSLMFVLSLSAQTTFERSYDFYNSAFSDLVFSQEDGYLMAMAGLKDKYYLSLVKTDLNGDTLWTKDYDRGIDYITDLYGTNDEQGNIYIACNDFAHENLLKLDMDGNILWAKNYTTLKLEMIVKNNVLWICGNASPLGNYLFKIDALTGDSLWRSNVFNVDNISGASSHATSIAVTENNEVVVTVSLANSFEPFLEQTQFFKLLPGANDLVEFSLDITNPFVVSDTKNLGNELISIANHPGYSLPNVTYLIRYTSDGTLLAFKEEIFGYYTAILYKCVITDENQVVAMGDASGGGQPGQVMLHAFSMSGDSLWTQLPGNYEQTGWDFKITGDNGFIITGGEEFPTNYKPFLIKTNSLGEINAIPEMVGLTLKAYPNPATGNVTFEIPGIRSGKIIIYNSIGAACCKLKIAGEKTVWDCNNYQPGIYAYSVISDGSFVSGKIVVK